MRLIDVAHETFFGMLFTTAGVLLLTGLTVLA